MKGILGKKIGMTQIFDASGALTPATVIEAGPCYVLQVKKKASDGYSAIQVGFQEAKESSMNKPGLKRFKKLKISPKRYIKEFKTPDELKVGDKIELGFEEGSFVDVAGTSIGKGFQGGVKRWGWAGGKGSHGSMHHRQVGSLSASSFPSRIFKGTHMPGRMGGKRITVQNIQVLKVDKENNLLVLKGAVPGHKNGLLIIKEAKKRKGILRPKEAKQDDKKPEKATAKKANKK